MADKNIKESLRQFIFEHIHSVEIIDVVLFLKAKGEVWCTADEISRELRASAHSIRERLAALESIGLAERLDQNQNQNQNPSESQFRFKPKTSELNDVVNTLAEEYKIRRHRILELVFSSSKRARVFADAFIVSSSPSKKESDNG